MKVVRPSAARPGFSLIELLMVLSITGILIAIAATQIGRQLSRDRVLRAATMVQGVLVEASQLAVRRRTPMRVVLSGSSVQVRQRAGDTLLRQWRFDAASDLQATLAFTPATGITIFPSGRADTTLAVVLTSATGRTTVTRSATGVVRRQ
jgi:prepilin-type N-terminal cleavage/methylation domain-containing protein